MKTTNKFLALALMAVAMVFASCSKDDDCTINNALTQQEIETKIIGKWKRTTTDGKDALTNNREVFTFAQNGVCLHSMSTSKDRWVWDNKLEMAYSITNNKLCIKDNIILNISVDKIDENQMFWTIESVLAHGVDIKDDSKVSYKKISTDYSHDIIGLWEGVSMTGDETYGNAEARIAYHADGTFTYYKKYADVWYPSDDVSCEYNVDGDWLATRWCPEEGADYNYEWWDIDEIKDGTMKWSALRERADGSRYNTTFTWKKVNEPIDDALLAKVKGEWEHVGGTEYLFTDGKLVEKEDFTLMSEQTLSISDDNTFRFFQLDEDGNPFVLMGCRFTVKGTLITFAIEEAPYSEWIGQTGRYVWFFLDDDTLAVASYEKEYNSDNYGLVIARYKRK